MTSADGIAPRPNRRLRSSKWFAPFCCGSILVLVAAFVVSLTFFIFALMRRSDVYKDALDKATANPQIRAELGEPIKEGWWVNGHLRTSGPTGNAALSIPLKGSRRTARSTRPPTSRQDNGPTTGWRSPSTAGRTGSSYWTP